MLEHLLYLLRIKKVFVRERAPIEIRALGIILVYLGLSYRKAAQVISVFHSVSHEAVGEWYKKSAKIFTMTVERKNRWAIAIDETKVKIGDKWHYIWVAIDIDTWEILGVYISRGRAYLDSLIFLKKVLKLCANKPYVYVDGGPWYPPALNRLGLLWEHKTFGERNAIEQFFSILKRRIKYFYKKWGKGTSLFSVLLWNMAFVSLFNIDFQLRKRWCLS